MFYISEKQIGLVQHLCKLTGKTYGVDLCDDAGLGIKAPGSLTADEAEILIDILKDEAGFEKRPLPRHRAAKAISESANVGGALGRVIQHVIGGKPWTIIADHGDTLACQRGRVVKNFNRTQLCL